MKKRLIFGLILISLLGVGVVSRPRSDAHAENANMVTVHIDGQERTVAVEAATVKEVLEKMGTNLAEHDKTEPKLDEAVKGNDFTINVYRARPITVIDGANNYTIMTAERSPRQIAEDAGFETKQEDEFGFQRSDDPFEGAPGTQMVIKRAKTITFDLYGTSSSLSTNETSVAGLLEERGVKLDADDEINVPLAARIVDGMTVSIASISKTVETKEEEAPFPEEQIRDAQQPTSYRKVETPGKNGKKLVTYEIITRNGGEPERRVIEEVITEQPVKQVVIVGAMGFSGSLADWLLALRMCETGGNYQRNSANGLYYGAYQFRIETWNSIARRVRPDLVGVRPDRASPADQDYMIIQNTKMSAGLRTQNPGCYKKTGISNQPPQ